MTYVVHVTMIEAENGQGMPDTDVKVHVEGKFEYRNLEMAREAAEVACHAAEKLHPSRTRTMDDDDWTTHPDRTD